MLNIISPIDQVVAHEFACTRVKVYGAFGADSQAVGIIAEFSLVIAFGEGAFSPSLAVVAGDYLGIVRALAAVAFR
jgi:hypothetical protein